MLLILLSANGTLRTILLLLVIWLVLRMIMRSRQPANGRPPGGQWTQDPPRPKGDVRIERPGERRTMGRDGSVEDADYEEIK
jgi:hypothetical protein